MNSTSIDMDSVKEILTRKEFTVFKYLLNGDSNKEIAEKLCVTQYTVKAHVSSILKKFDVKSRVQLLVKFRN